MPYERLVMATRAEGSGGIPTLIQAMMWCANFTYQPEYFVYSHLIGPALEEFVARVILNPRQVEGETDRTHAYQGKGSYPDVAIQDAAYKVMAGLCAHCFELQTSYAFIDFPRRISGSVNVVRYPDPAHPGTNRSQRQSELVRSLDIVC
jgi:hypothetical protein